MNAQIYHLPVNKVQSLHSSASGTGVTAICRVGGCASTSVCNLGFCFTHLSTYHQRQKLVEAIYSQAAVIASLAADTPLSALA